MYTTSPGIIGANSERMAPPSKTHEYYCVEAEFYQSAIDTIPFTRLSFYAIASKRQTNHIPDPGMRQKYFLRWELEWSTIKFPCSFELELPKFQVHKAYSMTFSMVCERLQSRQIKLKVRMLFTAQVNGTGVLGGVEMES